MKLLLWFTLLVVTFIAIQSTVDGGLIRRSRRLRRIGPYRRNGIRSPRVLNKRKWPHFLAPPRKLVWGRDNRRMRNEREERHPIRPGHHLRLPLMMAQPTLVQSSSTQLSSWRPLDFGSPIDRDPTFDYAPPALERVRFAERPDKRRRNNKPKPSGIMRSQQENGGKSRPQLFNRPRRPSIWKLLATKQRPRRPMVPRRRPPFVRHSDAQNSNDEAEIFPRLPNIYYFRPTDVLPSIATNPTIPTTPVRQSTNSGSFHLSPARPTFKPGKVTSVPLYSHEHQSTSQFNPVPITTTPLSTFIPSKPDDLLYRAQQYINPTRKPPTLLQPAKSTPVAVPATRNSAIKPVEPTQPTDVESIIDIINDPPKPLNSFTIFNSINSVFGGHQKINKPQLNNLKVAQESEIVNVKTTFDKPTTTTPATTTTTTTTLPTTTTTTTTTTPIPIVLEEIINDAKTAEESSTVSVSTSVSASTSVLVRAPQVSKSSTTTETSFSGDSPLYPSSPSLLYHSSPSPLYPSTPSPLYPSSPSPFYSSSPSPSYQKLPEMPTYKRRQPIYPKRYSSPKTSHVGIPSVVSSSKVSSNTPPSKDSNGSGEGLVITMARSKVKEYKPQLLANYTQLLTFDKVVADGDITDNEEPVTLLPSLHLNSATKSPVVSSIVSTQNVTSTEKSVLEEFDPMQLLHSWFQNT